MTRPHTYAKHAGRRQKKRRDEHQLGLAVDVPFHETVMVEFELWLERKRSEGATTFTLDEFRMDAKSVPRHVNSWGTFATNVKKRELGFYAQGHIRSKLPSANRRLVNLYRFGSAPD